MNHEAHEGHEGSADLAAACGGEAMCVFSHIAARQSRARQVSGCLQIARTLVGAAFVFFVSFVVPALGSAGMLLRVLLAQPAERKRANCQAASSVPRRTGRPIQKIAPSSHSQ